MEMVPTPKLRSPLQCGQLQFSGPSIEPWPFPKLWYIQQETSMPACLMRFTVSEGPLIPSTTPPQFTTAEVVEAIHREKQISRTARPTTTCRAPLLSTARRRFSSLSRPESVAR